MNPPRTQLTVCIQHPSLSGSYISFLKGSAGAPVPHGPMLLLATLVRVTGRNPCEVARVFLGFLASCSSRAHPFAWSSPLASSPLCQGGFCSGQLGFCWCWKDISTFGKGCHDTWFKFNWFSLVDTLLLGDHLSFVHLNRLLTDCVFASHWCSITD